MATSAPRILPLSSPTLAKHEWTESLSQPDPPWTIQTDIDSLSKRPSQEELSPTPDGRVAAIPDGGLDAWLQVLGSFFCFFSSWGVINAFGVYETYYKSSLLSSSTPSNISWIGAVQAFCLIFFGSAAGPIYDAGHFRLLIGGGSFLVVLGHMALSFSSSFWQVFLSQGLCVGLGAGLLFLPSVAILGTYFNTHLALAVGIAATGSSIGGVVYPLLLAKLLPTVGFAWSTRILGFVALGTLLISNTVMRLRVLPATTRKVVDLSAWKELPYTLFVIGSTVGYTGLYAVFFYVESYAINAHVVGENLGFYLLCIVNAGSFFGRIIPNWMADHIGPLNVIGPASIITGVLGFSLVATKSAASLVVVCALIGFAAGPLVSLSPSVYVSLSGHKRGMIGTRMGMGFMVNAFGILLAGPASGWVLGASNFTFVWVMVGALCVTGGLITVAARIAKTHSVSLKIKA